MSNEQRWACNEARDTTNQAKREARAKYEAQYSQLLKTEATDEAFAALWNEYDAIWQGLQCQYLRVVFAAN